MRVLLVSYFCSSNIGDCALSLALLNYFEKNNECMKIAYANDPFLLTDIENIQQSRLSNHISIKEKVMSILENFHLYAIAHFYYKTKRYFSKENEEKVNEMIEVSDYVVICGGNMIFDLDGCSLSAARLNYLIDLCKTKGKKVGIVSIGAGPFARKSQYNYSKKVLNKVDYISFRDSMSYKMYYQKINNNHIYLSSDPAFLIEKQMDKGRRGIGINIIDPYLFTSQKKSITYITEQYIKLINLVIEVFGKGNVIIFTTEIKDSEYAKMIAQKSKYSGREVRVFSSLNRLLDFYCGLEIVIGSRMHSCILAMTQYVPAIALSWQQKIDALYTDIDKRDFLFDMENWKAEDIVKCIETIKMFEREEIEDAIKKIILSMRKRFYLNDILSDIVNEDALNCIEIQK